MLSRIDSKHQSPYVTTGSRADVETFFVILFFPLCARIDITRYYAWLGRWILFSLVRLVSPSVASTIAKTTLVAAWTRAKKKSRDEKNRLFPRSLFFLSRLVGYIASVI
jgi:hypothetical protein